MQRTTFLLLPLLCALLFSAASCRRGSASAGVSVPEGGDVEMRHAVNLSMKELGGGVTLVSMRNPWDTLSVMRRYLLVPRDSAIPSTVPEGATVLRTPLRKAVVYSAVHIALIDELGRSDIVSGVCDSRYVHTPAVLEGLRDGRVADCGLNTDPDLERIAAAAPEAILLSPYEGSRDFSRLERLGTSVVECADYMEPTPLARAEWVRFYGRLTGCEARADSLFAEVERAYADIRERVAAAGGKRPRVMLDLPYQGVWYVPGGRSTMNCFLADAGAENIFRDRDVAGSLGLSAEEMLVEAGDADIWLIRYDLPAPLTLGSLAGENQLYTRFRPWKERHVWGCNSAESLLFDDLAFHPERLLGELASMFHPADDAESLGGHIYFKPLAE